jgi:hypothetical protein
MRPTATRTILAAAALLAAGCVHTHKVDDSSSGKDQPAPETETKASATPRAPPRVHPAPGHPAVAASPEALMNPGSARKIQEALRSKGYLETVSGDLDQPTSAALRRFQHDQQLATTGAPDRETLRRLGVDPQEVYRSVPQGQEATGSGR